MAGGSRDLWIFAYGSLMWRPGFPFEEARRARLTGHHRSFCVYSVHHRGSPSRPGLVLGLDRGGACEGIAYRIAWRNADAVLAGLRRREQVTAVYRETFAPVRLCDGPSEDVLAVAYLVERRHPAYAGALPLSKQARLIRFGRGKSGTNLNYFVSTFTHLETLAIRERRLERLFGMLGGFTARGGDDAGCSSRLRGLACACARAPHSGPKFTANGLDRLLYRNRVRGMQVALPVPPERQS